MLKEPPEFSKDLPWKSQCKFLRVKLLSIRLRLGAGPMSVYVILEQEGYEVKYNKAKN